LATNLPSQARVVIIGGGIMGCSVAYHLAKLGQRDVILLERSKLTSGSTWHAAGVVGQLRPSANLTKLIKYSVELYERLESEVGLATGWVRNGSLRLARNKDRRAEFERAGTTARSFGIEFEIISPSELKEMVPIFDVSGIDCAAWVPSDGKANPSDVTMALAKGARKNGVRIFEDTVVQAIETRNGAVASVLTDRGRITCEVVLNCGGIWSPEIGRFAGVNVPTLASHHTYFVTERIEGVPRHMPSFRDPDYETYGKEEVGGLVVGAVEHNPIPYEPDRIPDDHDFKLMEPDFDHLAPYIERATELIPALKTAGVKAWFNGLEAYTDDGNFVIGEAPETRNYFVGAGFNVFGIAAGGGAGRALAEWIVNGEATVDMWPVDIRRFGPFHRSRRTARARALEAQGRHYTMNWPHLEIEAARPLRRSPLYDRLAAAGACFGSKFGWERPNWFAPTGVKPVDTHSFERANWFPHVGAEHHAVRTRVGVFDQTSFAKFSIEGPDACAELQRLCSNDVDRAVGSVIYTQMLNRHGGIEADVTVSRIADDRYYMVTGTGFATHDLNWIQRNLSPGARVVVSDVTSACACIAVMGPRSREVLQPIAEGDLGNEAFPFATCKELFIGGCPARAVRITFVGELGWELHVPMEYAATLYDAITSSGSSFGVVDAGYRAIDSLRLEKGYRVWSVDIGPDYTPYDAGLGFAVRLDKKADFIGRDALVAARAKKPEVRFVTLTTDPDVVLLGRETIYRNGEQIGYLASGGFGYTVNRSIGMGYVRGDFVASKEALAQGTYELEVRTRRVPATIHLEPLYDPSGSRVRS
jgi:sarcosine dehydrogenase